jgi:hypothetical protein
MFHTFKEKINYNLENKLNSNLESLDEKKVELLTEDRNHEDAECYIN